MALLIAAGGHSGLLRRGERGDRNKWDVLKEVFGVFRVSLSEGSWKMREATTH